MRSFVLSPFTILASSQSNLTTSVGLRVFLLYGCSEAASIGATVTYFNPDKPFSFADYPITRARVDKLLSSLKNNVKTVIFNGINSEWTLSNNKNNELSRQVFGDNVGKLSQTQYRRYFSTNDDARKAFIARKESGLNLSDRVWKYTNQFKSEIELGLDVGIRSGQSAADMASDLQQFLKYPDKLFRRVRDEHGDLQLSKSAEAFHTGRGGYRSSYQNARRLAATETNIAYRTADHDRWQQLDFVVGIRIVLSNNHTTHDSKGHIVPLTDICDDLSAPLDFDPNDRITGCYPKDFKFTGWHPQCRCHAVTILKTEEEIQEDTRRLLNGEQPDGDSVNTVTDVPQEFKDWVKENDGRIAMSNARGTLPYFLKDNRKAWADISTVKIINQQTIGKTAAYAITFGNKTESIARSLGVTATPVNIKSESRILEKAISDYRGDVAQVADIIRNTFIVPTEDIQRVLASVQDKVTVIKYKPQHTNMGYSGHLFQVWAKDGIKAEIQVNTPQMIYAKDPTAKAILGDELYCLIRKESGVQCGLGHKYYEEYRILSKADQQTAKGLELQRKSQEYYERIQAVKL